MVLIIPLSQYAHLTDPLWVQERFNGMLCHTMRWCAMMDDAVADAARDHDEEALRRLRPRVFKNNTRASQLGAFLGPLAYVDYTGRIPGRDAPLTDEERSRIAGIRASIAVEQLQRLKVDLGRLLEYCVAAFPSVTKMYDRLPLPKRKLFFSAVDKVIEGRLSGVLIRDLSGRLDDRCLVIDDETLATSLHCMDYEALLSHLDAMLNRDGNGRGVPEDDHVPGIVSATASTLINLSNICSLLMTVAALAPDRGFALADGIRLCIDPGGFMKRYTRMLDPLFLHCGITPNQLLTYPLVIAERAKAS